MHDTMPTIYSANVSPTALGLIGYGTAGCGTHSPGIGEKRRFDAGLYLHKSPLSGQKYMKEETNVSDQDYLKADDEVISMVSGASKSGLPLVAVLVPLEKVQQIDEAEANIEQMKRIGAAAIRAGVGLIFLGGMTRGLMEPGFAVLVALACAIWAWVSWKRGR